MRGSSVPFVVGALICLTALPPVGAGEDLGSGLQIIEVAPQDERRDALEGDKPQGVVGSREGVRFPQAVLGQDLPREVEPNGTAGTANPLPSTNSVVLGNVFPVADLDFFSFSANAGDRVYVATMGGLSAVSGTGDTAIDLLDTDGATSIEFDDDDGVIGGFSSTIAGAVIPANGTYFIRVRGFGTFPGTTAVRPYHLHFRLQSGAPTPEVEPNDTPGTANPLPVGGWVSGTRDPAVATEQDWYSFTANAGDTVFLNLDLDPERDAVTWNGRLGIALFGDANNLILVVDDNSAVGATNPFLSEAHFMTIKTAGTYFAFVDSASAAVGGPTATYNLSVSILPSANQGVNCTTYTSTNVPQIIGPGAGLVSSTITVPGNPRIADLDVEIQLNHTLMADLDMHLRSPAGNDNGLFTDIGAAAVGGQAQMDAIFDDEAAIPPVFTVLRPMVVGPELNYRLAWFDGEDAGGTWTLDIRDDITNASGGTLTGWSLRICEPPPPPACPPGSNPVTVFSTDFESGAAGFTHSGVADEWELGLPATAGTTTANPVAAFTTCNSGVSCWKTDLDNTYDISSNQDLLSPNIDLAGVVGPVVVSWAQRYQLETATFDHVFVDYQQAGGATPVRLFEWLDATMTNGPGNPVVNIGESAGWARMTARADSLAGLNTEMRFHLDSDSSINFAGLAIDDVSVTACQILDADLSITKTDGVTTAIPGTTVTYAIVGSNAGPAAIVGGTVADTFPASLSCNWTCVGAGGGTCTAAGAGNINDTVNLPVGGSVTYTAVCSIDPAATGSLTNTATISSAEPDPNPGNNSATDTDTLAPTADVGITKDDGVTTAIPGGSVTYTIAASNPGPSDAPGTTVSDTFSGVLACSWTCVGAGGGTCTPGPVGGNINDSADLPAGGSATYTASCAIDPAASGTLSNTATAAVAGGVTDPTPGNNSATDVDNLVPTADLGLTKDDNVTVVFPGGSVTYTIVASNPGPSAANGNVVTDQFQADLTCSWTCAGSGGGTCTPGPVNGDINDTANLPAGASATYTASCTLSPTASGTLTNAASMTPGPGVTDPNPSNNAGTDIDIIGQSLSIGDVTVAEGDAGNTPADFAVTLAAPVAVTVTVDFTTQDGTATVADNDYNALVGTVIFAPGETVAFVSASVVGDTNFEADENFFVSLSNATNAVILDGIGEGTILNDDKPLAVDSRDELVHDSRESRDLDSISKFWRISQKAHSSYEVIVDAVTGDIVGAGGPDLLRLDADGTTVLQTAGPATSGSSKSLRFENASAANNDAEFIRVRSAGCVADCDSGDTFRVRAYDTTYRMSRFNNSASQITVVVIANPTDEIVTGTLWFYDATGNLATNQPVTIVRKGTFVLNTSTVVTGAGSATFSNDAAFGALTGKAVAVEPATGFTFDTPMVPRAAATKMVPRDN